MNHNLEYLCNRAVGKNEVKKKIIAKGQMVPVSERNPILVV